jgi:hypothetical protein
MRELGSLLGMLVGFLGWVRFVVWFLDLPSFLGATALDPNIPFVAALVISGVVMALAGGMLGGLAGAGLARVLFGKRIEK